MSTIDRLDPKPPTIDRAIAPLGGQTLREVVKYSDFVEYSISGDRIKLIQIAFHQYKIARQWEAELIAWGGKASKPHQISRNGKKWLLLVEDLPLSRLDDILTAELGQTPKPPSRK